jgi:hypothetical protein
MTLVLDWISELNDHGFTDTGTTRKLGMLNDTLWDIYSREPWPFLEKEATLHFDGSSAAPTDQPSDFRAVTDLVRGSDGGPVGHIRMDELKKQFGTDLVSVGVPVYFYFRKNALRLWKVPASSETAILGYIHTPPAITDASADSAILLPTQHARAAVLGTLYKLYDLEDDPELAVRFQQQYEARIQSMRADVWTLQFDRPDHIQVIDPDDYDYL